MDFRSTFNWMLLVLTLCVLIPQTDCISSQCTERPLGPIVTELCHEKISTSTVTFSCRSHPGVKMVVRNVLVVESPKIDINVTGNCLRLMEATRPAGCSLLAIGYEKRTIDCTIPDTSYNKSETDTEHVTSPANKGDSDGLYLTLIISCSGLLCAGFLVLCFNGEYDQVPDGNNENCDDLEMQSM